MKKKYYKPEILNEYHWRWEEEKEKFKDVKHMKRAALDSNSGSQAKRLH